MDEVTVWSWSGGLGEDVFSAVDKAGSCGTRLRRVCTAGDAK